MLRNAPFCAGCVITVQAPHVADLDDFAADVGYHLRMSWHRGVPLHVTDAERRTLVIDTVIDLELAHEVIASRGR